MIKGGRKEIVTANRSRSERNRTRLGWITGNMETSKVVESCTREQASKEVVALQAIPIDS